MKKENHSAYVDGHVEPIEEFDMDSIDRGSPLTAEIERHGHGREISIVEQFTRAIAEIYNSHNAKKSAACFLIATGGSAAEGRKIVSTAREFGVSKQDISKCCVEWCEFMGIPPSTYMRQLAAKESFQNSNSRKQKS